MLNYSWFVVTLAQDSICAQGYPQKVWKTGWTFTTPRWPCTVPS